MSGYQQHYLPLSSWSLLQKLVVNSHIWMISSVSQKVGAAFAEAQRQKPSQFDWPLVGWPPPKLPPTVIVVTNGWLLSLIIIMCSSVAVTISHYYCHYCSSVSLPLRLLV